MRARRAPQRGPGRQRHADRGRAARRRAKRSTSRRCAVKLWETEVDGTSTRCPRSTAPARVMMPAARQDARRLELDQRDGLHPRQPRSTTTPGRPTARRGWGYDDLLPYFMRSEDNERGADAWHGSAGRSTSSDSARSNPMAQAFVDAGDRGRARRRTTTSTRAEQDGVGWYQLTQRDGMRCSAAVAYLHPALGRPNLTVESYVQVARVVFDGTRAVGVAGRSASARR